MDNQQTAPFELPVPDRPTGGSAIERPMAVEAAPAISPERLPAVGNTPTASPMPLPASVPAAQPMQPVGQGIVPPPPSGAPGAGFVPAAAHDTDLIEKEWVMKAKQIVAQTRTDPYQQNRQINRFKADYIKKRYNKDIKTAE